MYKKIHSQYFSKSNYNHKDLWFSSKYKIKKNQFNIILSQPVFLKTMHSYYTKDIYIYKMSHFNFYYFYFTPYLIYNYNTASRTEDPEKVFGLQHLHLKNILKQKTVTQTGSMSIISSKCRCLLFVPPNMKRCTEMVIKLFMRKLSFCYENHF